MTVPPNQEANSAQLFTNTFKISGYDRNNSQFYKL